MNEAELTTISRPRRPIGASTGHSPINAEPARSGDTGDPPSLLPSDQWARRLRRRIDRALVNLAPARRFRLHLACRELQRNMGAERPRYVLDAGCQYGLLSLDLARRRPCWVVVAGDIDLAALVQVRTSARSAGLTNVFPVQMDLTSPLPVRGFDAAVAIECLSEIRDDEGVLRNLARALRPGGSLYLHVPQWDWRPVLGGSPTEWYGNVRRGYASDELIYLLDSAGLVVMDVRRTTFSLLHLAEEIRYRWLRQASSRRRLAILPLLRLAEWSERHGILFGSARGLFVVASRRGDGRPVEEA